MNIDKIVSLLVEFRYELLIFFSNFVNDNVLRFTSIGRLFASKQITLWQCIAEKCRTEQKKSKIRNPQWDHCMHDLFIHHARHIASDS